MRCGDERVMRWLEPCVVAVCSAFGGVRGFSALGGWLLCWSLCVSCSGGVRLLCAAGFLDFRVVRIIQQPSLRQCSWAFLVFLLRMFLSHGDDCGSEVAGSYLPSIYEIWPAIRVCDTIELADWTRFKSFLTKRAACFLDHQELQYVVVKNVSTGDVEYIDSLRGYGDFPQMRILYAEEERLLIVKLVPGVLHQVAGVCFAEMFRELVPKSSGIRAYGSTRFGEVSQTHKEADVSFLQDIRCPAPDWPSVVVETGVSESLSMLRQDAAYWLISSERRVMVVILILINLVSRDATLERWEHVGRVTRSHPRICPTLMQTVHLPNGGPVVGAPFYIPSDKIWDVVPANIGAVIEINAQQLESFSRELISC